MDSGQSRPASPVDVPAVPGRHRPRLNDVPSDISRRPTFEQHMAFAALQQSQELDGDKS